MDDKQVTLVTVGKGKSVHLEGMPDRMADKQPNGLSGVGGSAGQPVYVPACGRLATAIKAGKGIVPGGTYRLSVALTVPLTEGFTLCSTCNVAAREELARLELSEQLAAKPAPASEPVSSHARSNYADLAKHADTEPARTYWARKAVSA